MRDTQLVLLADGGAELINAETEDTIWASDSDEEFGEEFPELLDENDLPHLMDYLEDHQILTARELEVCEPMYEPLDGPGDDEEDGDEEEDEETDEEWADDGDIIDGEAIEHE